jgi:hypothetical protein
MLRYEGDDCSDDRVSKHLGNVGQFLTNYTV